jgi:hypothetical protein
MALSVTLQWQLPQMPKVPNCQVAYRRMAGPESGMLSMPRH